MRTRVVMFPALGWLGIRELDHEALSAPAKLHVSLCTSTCPGHALFFDLATRKNKISTTDRVKDEDDVVQGGKGSARVTSG